MATSPTTNTVEPEMTSLTMNTVGEMTSQSTRTIVMTIAKKMVNDHA